MIELCKWNLRDFKRLPLATVLLRGLGMTPGEMKQRTKKFALDIIRFTSALPSGITIDVIRRQLLSAGTGVAANYRASCRAKSRKDFVMKMTNAEEEADESALWLEILGESGLAAAGSTTPLLDEADQLTRIFVASINTARKGKRSEKSRNRTIEN